MVIGFKKQFKDPIMAGDKIHTIREDTHNRCKAGMAMHMATGVRTKNYEQFMLATCVSTQKIEIVIEKRIINDYENIFHKILIDNKMLSVEQFARLARNDGFKSESEFINFFNKGFCGKIIHWTDFRY